MNPTSIDRDFLCSLSPIFRLDSVKIYWADNVFKVGQTNSLQPRILIIASPGIFLIRRKSFTFQSRIINSISFCDLVSLYVAGHCVSFSSKQTQIRVKHRNITDVAFLAFFIRQAQFPTDVLPLNITFADENLAVKITPEQSPYQPSSLFLDRVLSCVMHYSLMVTNSMFSYFPQPSHRSFTITNELLSSPLFKAFVLSLAYEQDVDTLKLTNVTVGKVLSQCTHLIRYNRFIQTIHFIEADFENSKNVIISMLNKAHGFKPTKWVFEKCDLSLPDFIQFFDSLSNLGKQITHLRFVKCTFSDETFSSLFQTIFFNESFHSLQHFVIDNTNARNIIMHVSEILCCSWAMELKCFHQLALIRCDSDDCSEFLSQLFTFDVGMQFINMSENNFISPLTLKDDFALRELSFLGLCKCKMSSQFLMSFIDIIKKYKISISGLDLSFLSLNQQEFNDFLIAFSELKIPDLETLLFDYNRMNSNQTKLFTNFLKLQPSLKHLSINCSFDIKESPNGLLYFINYISKQPLITLSFQGDCSLGGSFGPLLVPLLEALKSIQNLDITNQMVGQDGLKILVPLIANNQLSELHFDGSNVKDRKFLCQFCSTILSCKKIEFASFPTKDFEKKLSELHTISESDDNWNNEIATLQNGFKKKFNEKRDILTVFKYIALTHSLGKSNSFYKPNKSTKAIYRVESFSQLPTNYHDATIMQPDIKKLFDECIDENEKITEPIVLLMTNIENSLSFDSLLAGI